MAANWGKLYIQGRCKAFGVSWSEEDLNALNNLKIPVEYVRRGILTLKEYEQAKDSIELLKDKEVLMKEAKEVGLEATPDASAETLTKEIKKAKK